METLTIRALKIALRDNGNGALDWATSYGEPGYSDTRKGILLANWNETERTIAARIDQRDAANREQDKLGKLPEYKFTSAQERAKRLHDRLEAQGYALEWSDEWIVDYDHNSKAYRTQPDSHAWEARIRVCDGYFLTPDDDADRWIEDALNEDARPLPSWFDTDELTRHGFARWEAKADQEVGFHPGQNDTPSKFVPRLRAEGFDFILVITGRSQFDSRYDVWTRREARHELLFDDASGVYIPQRFANEIARDRVTGVSDADYAVLETGPEHPDYWETWDDVLRTAVITDGHDTKLTMSQDGVVFITEQGAEYCEYLDKHFTHK